MYVSRVELQNWMNFRRASASLRKRVFLIGPNASGKSNFLDALRFLRDLTELGLSRAVEKRSGVSAIRCLAARESSSISVSVELSDDQGTPIWRYSIEFNQDAHRQPIIRREEVTRLDSKKTLLLRPDDLDRDDALRLTQSAVQQIGANRDFREIADYFEGISYQHLIPQVVRDPRGFSAVPVQNDPFGRDLLLRAYTTDAKTRDARLKRIAHVLRQAVPQLQQLEIAMDDRGIPHLIGRYEHWRPHAAKQDETQFSDGTLRLFGLMWGMLDGTGLLLLEEPELSLHSEVIRALPQMFIRLQQEIRRMKRKGDLPERQIILSTHSQELLSDPGIAPEEVLVIEPATEGAKINSPADSDVDAMAQGLTAADVLLPRSRPRCGQLTFDFD